MDTILKVDEIQDEIVWELNRRCTCDLTTSHITEPVLECLNLEKSAVTFRAKLHGTPSSTIEDLRVHLMEWISTPESSVVVKSIRYDVSNLCTATAVSARSDEGCRNETSIEVPGNTLLIVVGAGAAVLTMLILAVVCGVVICVIVCINRKQPPPNIR